MLVLWEEPWKLRDCSQYKPSCERALTNVWVNAFGDCRIGGRGYNADVSITGETYIMYQLLDHRALVYT